MSVGFRERKGGSPLTCGRTTRPHARQQAAGKCRSRYSDISKVALSVYRGAATRGAGEAGASPPVIAFDKYPDGTPGAARMRRSVVELANHK